MPRYLFKAAIASIRIGPDSEKMKMWFGLESDEPIDIEEYSLDTRRDLIPPARG
jgi:hypothetical protein